MIQHYVLCSLGLFFSYWSSRPALTLALLLTIDILWAGVFEFESGASRDDIKELTLFRPLSLLMGVIVGGTTSFIIDKPLYPVPSMEHWLYHLCCLIGSLLWIMTALFWQLLPQVWWNYTFLVLMIQFILVVLSYFIVAHDRAWQTPEGRHNSLIVHYHFLLLSVLLLDVPFVVGQSVAPGIWPFYYSIAFFGAATFYALLILSCHQVRIPMYLPTSSSETLTPLAEQVVQKKQHFDVY